MTSTSMRTSIDGAVGRGFGMTRGDRARGNLAVDNGRSQAETVLSDAEEAEHDMD